MESAKIRLEKKFKFRAKQHGITGVKRDALIFDTLEDAGFGPQPPKTQVRPRGKK